MSRATGLCASSAYSVAYRVDRGVFVQFHLDMLCHCTERKRVASGVSWDEDDKEYVVRIFLGAKCCVVGGQGVQMNRKGNHGKDQRQDDKK